MAIAKMKKVTIIALQSEKGEIVKALQRFGNMQVVNLEGQVQEGELRELGPDGDNDNVNRLESRLSQVKYALDFVSKFDKSKKPLFSFKVQIQESHYNEYLNSDEKLDGLYGNCKAIDGKFAEIKNSETKLNSLISQLSPWNNLDAPINDIKSTNNVNIVMGSVPIENSEEFLKLMADAGADTYVEEINKDNKNNYLVVAYNKSDEEKIVPLLKQASWSKEDLGYLEGTAKDNISRINSELKELEEKKQGLTRQAEDLISYKEYLQVLFDALTIERDRSSITKNFIKTEKTFMCYGWVPEKSENSLKRAISSITDRYTMQFEDPGEDEDFPVLLNNAKLVKPVEIITEQYSLPSSRGFDPNPIMAPFFIMFFGMMLSDAAYGIILAAGTAYALFKLKPEGGLKKILGLMCLGGISALLWGALFGGWFGEPLIRPLWFSPLDNPLFMLIFCIGVGIIHLYIGMGIQAYISIRDGKLLDALFDQGLWYVFLTGLLLLAIPQTAAAGKYMAIIGAAGLVLTQGRSEKNILKKLVSGILSLYNVTGFLGDALSYSRLFALGLATGVIGIVINSMALMLAGSFIGNIFMVVFLVFGHTFNIAINILGAYVHSSRLHYVEFFSKFYEGDGLPFNPFKIKTRYTEQK